MLGRSSITITAATYTSLLAEADLAIAEATARLASRADPASEGRAVIRFIRLPTPYRSVRSRIAHALPAAGQRLVRPARGRSPR